MMARPSPRRMQRALRLFACELQTHFFSLSFNSSSHKPYGSTAARRRLYVWSRPLDGEPSGAKLAIHCRRPGQRAFPRCDRHADLARPPSAIISRTFGCPCLNLAKTLLENAGIAVVRLHTLSTLGLSTPALWPPHCVRSSCSPPNSTRLAPLCHSLCRRG